MIVVFVMIRLIIIRWFHVVRIYFVDNVLLNGYIQIKILVHCVDYNINTLYNLHNEIYKGLTIHNYIVPLMDIDIDPSLREVHEYDKDYDECIAEEENNTFKFNLS